MVDDHAASLVVERLRQNDTAGVDRCHRRAHLCMIVETAMDAGEFSIEDALIAKGVGLRRKVQRRKEVSRPLRLRRRIGEGFVFHDLVGGDFFQGRSIGFDKFIRHAQRHLFIGSLLYVDILMQASGECRL